MPISKTFISIGLSIVWGQLTYASSQRLICYWPQGNQIVLSQSLEGLGDLGTRQSKVFRSQRFDGGRYFADVRVSSSKEGSGVKSIELYDSEKFTYAQTLYHPSSLPNGVKKRAKLYAFEFEFNDEFEVPMEANSDHNESISRGTFIGSSSSENGIMARNFGAIDCDVRKPK